MQGYYNVVPAFISTHSDLTDGEKNFYTILCGLMTKYGFCWATNKYLARMAHKTPRQIPRYLAKFKVMNMLIVEIENKFERKIWMPETWARRDELKKAFEHDQKFNQRFDRIDMDVNGGLTLMSSKEYKTNIYKEKGGTRINAVAVEVVEKPPLPPSSQKFKKKDPPIITPPTLSTSEQEKLIDMMGLEKLKHYKQNALAHLKKTAPTSINHKITFSELIFKFWSLDEEKNKKRAEEKKNGVTSRQALRKIWFEEVCKRNAQVSGQFEAFTTEVQLMSSGVSSYYVAYSAKDFYEQVEQRLIKIQEVTGIPYSLPGRDEADG